MSAKSIYLGGSPPEEIPSSVDVSGVETLDELRYGIAKLFSIADSKCKSILVFKEATDSRLRY